MAKIWPSPPLYVGGSSRRKRALWDVAISQQQQHSGITTNPALSEVVANRHGEFLEWHKTPAPHDGYIEWLRREQEKLHRKPVPMPPQTNYAKGSMEWFQQQEELRRHRQGIEAMPDLGSSGVQSSLASN